MRSSLSSPKRLLGWIAVFAVLLLPMLRVSGALEMFLNLAGIDGPIDNGAKSGDMQILSWSFGASNSGTTHFGTGTATGKANVQDISVTKPMDKASPDLLLRVLNGSHLTSGTLRVRETAAKVPYDVLTIAMTDIIVTSYSTGGSAGEAAMTENLSLNFAQFTLTFDDGAGNQPSITWDIAGAATE